MKFTAPLLVLILALIAISTWSCVDVPSSGFTPPNYRSGVRFNHAGRGIDTVAIFRSVDTTTTQTTSSSQVIAGTDTIDIRDTLVVTRVRNIYNRVRMNFGGSFTLLVDNASKGSLALGQGTSYLNIASGTRRIKLQANPALIDSVPILKFDSVRVTVWDTVGTGRGTKRRDTTMTGTVDTIRIAKTGTLANAIVDSADLSIGTQTKVTVFLIGDTTSTFSTAGGALRYGWIKYVIGTERATYEAAVVVDTALVRLANASTALARDTVGVGSNTLRFTFSTVTRYVKLPASADSTYLLTFSKSGSAAILDSTLVSKAKRYTIVVIDSASTYVVRKYNDD